MKVKRFPTHDTFNGWTNTLSPRQYRPAQSEEKRVGLLLIGTGAAGLAWTGQIALSQNFAPGFGQQDTNVYSAMVPNGVGMTKGTMAGRLAAEMAAGEKSQLLEDMLALGKPGKLPPESFLCPGMFAKVRWWEKTSRFER